MEWFGTAGLLANHEWPERPGNSVTIIVLVGTAGWMGFGVKGFLTWVSGVGFELLGA